MSEAQPTLEELMQQPNISEMPWIDPPSLPPGDLPYDDGEPMESPWHASSGSLLKASYIAARGGTMDDYYVGVNMFVYYSWNQVRNKDFKGPDAYIAHDVEGQRRRLYWAIWDEDGRYPDVIFEFLSESTEREDLGSKKAIYERTFKVAEYFCIAPEVARLMGWHLVDGALIPIEPDAHGRLWSRRMGLWLGPWEGFYLGERHTWPRLYHPDGRLVLLPEEAEKIRADTEQQRAEAEKIRADTEQQRAEAEKIRADELAARVAALEQELRQLHGEA